jgi:hypothetical protein
VDEDSIYNPILADVWAVGDGINNFHRRFGSAPKSIGTVVEEVTKELRVDNTTKRLSLHDAEWQIAAACSTVATVRCPPSTVPRTQGIHSPGFRPDTLLSFRNTSLVPRVLSGWTWAPQYSSQSSEKVSTGLVLPIWSDAVASVSPMPFSLVPPIVPKHPCDLTVFFTSHRSLLSLICVQY